jgi:hypothetical protein
MKNHIVTAFLTIMLGISLAILWSASHVYRVSYLNKSEIGIVCRNGADPTGTKQGEMVIISCGKDSQ